MRDVPISADRPRAEIGATTPQGDPLTVAIAATVPGGRRHVALRWPYTAPHGPGDAPAGQLDGIDVTSGEALALGVLLVRAHDRIERGAATAAATGRANVMVGRVRLNRPGGADLIAVRIGRNVTSGGAAIGVHWHRDGADPAEPRLMWFSLRDARVFARMLDVLGAGRVAVLVRRAVALATDVHTGQDEEGDR